MKSRSVILSWRYVISISYLYSVSAYAGPEPDDGYKLLISTIAVIGLIGAYCCSVGYLARSLGRGYWRWCLFQIVASSAGLALFGWTMSLWQPPPDMSALALLLTDLVFDTWSLANLLLFFSGFAFLSPIIGLCLLSTISFFRFTKDSGSSLKIR